MKMIISIFFLLATFMIQSCGDKEEVNVSLIPQDFSIDIPEVLTEDPTNGRINQDEVVEGGLIYANLRLFIKVGETWKSAL